MGYNRDALASFLGTILKNVTTEQIDEANHRRFRFIAGAGVTVQMQNESGTFSGKMPDDAGPTLRITDEGVDAFDHFVEETLKDDSFSTQIGKAAVINVLDQYIQRAMQDPPSAPLREEVRHKILKPLKESIKNWVCLIPIANLHISTKYSLGNVQFVPSAEGMDEIHGFIENHQFEGNAEEAEAQEHQVRQITRGTLSGYPAFARVHVSCHEKHAPDASEAHAAFAINLARAFCNLIHPKQHRAIFGLPHEVAQVVLPNISIDYSDDHKISLNLSKQGFLWPFTLNADVLDTMRSEFRFDVVEDIVQRPPSQRSEAERISLEAIQAIGRAAVMPTIDMAFVNHTIAIERVLIRDGEETTTERLKDRLALLIGRSADQRQDIARSAKRLYGIRSKVVHAAFSGVTKEDADTMEGWALHTAISFLSRVPELMCHKDFCQELEARKFSG